MNSRTCLLERILIKTGFVLIHDGQRNPGQFKLPPNEIKCFTRKYRLKLDGEFVNTWITFKYDDRSPFADPEVYIHDPGSHSKQKMILATEEETSNGNEDRMSTMQEDAEGLANLR